MSAPVDVLAVPGHSSAEVATWTAQQAIAFMAAEMSAYRPDIEAKCKEARAAVAELIERDKKAQQVFDCILRAVNDTSGEMGYRSLQYVPSWLECWARSLLAAGFAPTNPDASDIRAGLAKVVQP